MERFRGGLQQQGPGLGGKGDLKELHSKQDKAVLESATEVISDGEDDGMKIETAGVIKQGIDSVVTNLENIREYALQKLPRKNLPQPKRPELATLARPLQPCSLLPGRAIQT